MTESLRKELPLYKKPARYVNSEINVRRKNWEDAYIKVLFVYPDTYEIGMSSYGYHLVYHVLNLVPGVLCDRAFLPWVDLIERLKKDGIPLWGLETKKAGFEFDIVAFTLQYELCYSNVLHFLELSQIPIFSEDRKKHVVIAGGPCTTNPLPLVPFIDAFFIGEWESELLRVFSELVKRRLKGKDEILSFFSENPHIFVPGKNQGAYARKERRLEIFPDPPILPLLDVPHNRITVEIARGCSRGCRFCHAGFVNRPVRERNVDEIMKIVEASFKTTGFEEVSLLSLSATDHSQIKEIIKELVRFTEKAKISISLPSLRAGTLTPDVVEAVRSVKKSGFTIAPEAGSERLRRVINKNITEDEVLETVEKAVTAGWLTMKFYFMIGLPTETWEDVEAIGDLISKVLRLTRGFKRKPKFNVTVSPFVPKPHTPFQWEPQEEFPKLKEKIEYLEHRFRKSRVKIKAHNPLQSMLEAFFSRAGSEAYKVLYRAFELGAVFDEWGELFRWSIWEEAFEEMEIDPRTVLSGFPVESELPWEIIDVGVKRDFLIEEREKALKSQPTEDCRVICTNCGVCGKDLKTVSAASIHMPCAIKLPEFMDKKNAKVLFFISRRYPITLLGQNDFEILLQRLLRKAGIPLAYSQGFHPKPIISFVDATPVGVEVEEEPFEVTLFRKVTEEEVEAFRSFLPKGVELKRVTEVSMNFSLSKVPKLVEYKIYVPVSILREGWIDILNEKDCHFETEGEYVLIKVYRGIKPLSLLEKILKNPERRRSVKVVKKIKLVGAEE